MDETTIGLIAGATGVIGTLLSLVGLRGWVIIVGGLIFSLLASFLFGWSHHTLARESAFNFLIGWVDAAGMAFGIGKGGEMAAKKAIENAPEGAMARVVQSLTGTGDGTK